MKKLIIYFFGLIVITGCATIGHQFNTESVPQIKIGTTTIDEVKNTFGKPYRKGIDSGDQTWTYVYYKLNLLGSNRTRDLYVTFDKKGIVKSYTYNTNFPEENIIFPSSQ